MSGKPAVEGNYNLVTVWLDRARKNASRCFICDRIAKANSSGAGGLQTIRISGVEMNAETQISHLCRCVGGGNDSPGVPQGR